MGFSKLFVEIKSLNLSKKFIRVWYTKDDKNIKIIFWIIEIKSE